MAHPDHPAEQAYLNRAYGSLDRMRASLLRVAEAGATEVASEAIEDWASGRLRTFADAEQGLCFGRIDSEAAADPVYVGRRWVQRSGSSSAPRRLARRPAHLATRL